MTIRVAFHVRRKYTTPSPHIYVFMFVKCVKFITHIMFRRRCVQKNIIFDSLKLKPHHFHLKFEI